MQDFRQGIVPLTATLAFGIAVLWIALPFAVFGIKERLDVILVALKTMNRADRDGASWGWLAR
ncbi:hypothetical protein KVP09_04375 [Alcaligenaceae bacterium CGII-47]|nr:hypothetical protein [Alcaligenaceae bacterium CGII-47]